MGNPECLLGKTFVITGGLDSMYRGDAENLIKRHSGRVTSAVSGKTTFLLCGEGAGKRKVAVVRTTSFLLLILWLFIIFRCGGKPPCHSAQTAASFCVLLRLAYVNMSRRAVVSARGEPSRQLHLSAAVAHRGWLKSYGQRFLEAMNLVRERQYPCCKSRLWPHRYGNVADLPSPLTVMECAVICVTLLPSLSM